MPYRILTLLGALFAPALAFAEQGVLVNPLNAGSLPELVGVVLDAMIELGSIALVLALVWVGFRFVSAQGNPSKIEKAREALMYTVIGGLILLGSAAISMVVQQTVQSL